MLLYQCLLALDDPLVKWFNTLPSQGSIHGFETHTDHHQKLEETLLEIARLKEEKDKQLLDLEVVIGVIATITFLILIFIACYFDMNYILRIVLIVIGSIIFAYGCGNAVKIEQVAGYYECKECHHKYVPTYNAVFFAMHRGRTRKMNCPKCNKKTWQKKVLK